MPATQSPTFFLYGEPHRPASCGFVHLEPIDTRSRPAGWMIRPHRHQDLHHLFVVIGGTGEVRLAGASIALAAPCLLVVPCGLVHAFAFSPDTTGRVLTITESWLQDLPRPDAELAGIFATPTMIQVGTELPWILANLDRLAPELAWRVPGHAAAVRATLLNVLVAAWRLRDANEGRPRQASLDARLVARYRDMIEARFRQPRPVETYAADLGVSISRLRGACRALGCGAPLHLVQARQVLEARSALLHSDMSVAEIALRLGYEDASYFIRLFKRHQGVSPGRLRHHPSLPLTK